MKSWGCGLVAALAASSCVSVAEATRSAKEFDWANITPTRHLEYHDCFGEFKCARLEVPLDWLNETDTRTVAIAMIKLPAVVPDDDAAFGGSIFTNPGGPGGSGVGFVRAGSGHQLQSVVDKPGRRHYEIVSFDPRGVGASTPAVNCYRQNVLARDADMLEARGQGGLDRGLFAVSYGLALTDGVARRCQESEELLGEEILAYVGTANVARDMVEMIDRIDQLRSSDFPEPQGDGGETRETAPREELRKRHAHDGRQKGQEPRLQYIGFSYGTALGNYFASMFPGRVGRLVLDGVLNIHDYAKGPGWLSNTVDGDEIFDNFISGCHAAGPSICALAREDDVSDKHLHSRVWAWIDALNKSPRSAVDPISGNSAVVSGNDVLLLIALILYQPIVGFRPLASVINELMTGDLSSLATIIVAGGLVPVLRDACPVGGNGSDPLVTDFADVRNAVVCDDGDDVNGKDAAWWNDYVGLQVNTSSVFGNIWSSIRFACASWPFQPNWAFKGPFTTPKHDASLKEGRPAAPILFVTNRLDPVTPLRAARAMSADHPGSALVIQEAMGHTALFSAQSSCTRNIIADYFDTGAVPDGEFVCKTIPCGPWDEKCPIFDAESDLSTFSTSYVHTERHSMPWRKFPLGVY